MTAAADEPFCYLVTRGRVSGRPHEIEIWFVTADGATLFLMAGGRDGADWVRNLMKDPDVTVRIANTTYPARARVVAEPTDEDNNARQLMLAKYDNDGDLASWGVSALVVALDLHDAALEA